MDSFSLPLITLKIDRGKLKKGPAIALAVDRCKSKRRAASAFVVLDRVNASPPHRTRRDFQSFIWNSAKDVSTRSHGRTNKQARKLGKLVKVSATIVAKSLGDWSSKASEAGVVCPPVYGLCPAALPRENRSRTDEISLLSLTGYRADFCNLPKLASLSLSRFHE